MILNTRNILTLLLLAGFIYSTNGWDYRHHLPPNSRNSQSTAFNLADDGRHFLQVGIALLGSPVRFSQADWRRTGSFVGATILLFAIDKDVRHFALSHQNHFNDNLFQFDKYHGNRYSLGFALLLYGGGHLTKNHSFRKMGLYSIEAFLYAGAVSSLVKGILGRRRPYGGNSQLVFKPLQLKDSFQALPSGHTTVAFAVSTVMAKSVDSLPWKFFWYGAAGLVAASRVYHNQHWVSDVFLGGVIGYSVANFIVKFRPDSPDGKPGNLGNRISPYLAPGKIGIRLYFP